jgi:iron complex outermembrane receptor protein
MKRFLISSILAIFISVFAFTQENIRSVLKDTINLDEVVVTGTTVKVNRHNIPMAVSVVNNLQISESNETSLLPVLNGRVPGLFVTERGVMGFGVAANAAGQISIRGIGGSPTTGVLIMIDGHPQFMGIFGHPLPDSYIASDVERVEVIRGPGSILYGSNAMGGVINIITKKQSREGFSGNAHLMYGSYNTQKYMASAGYKKNRFSIFASVNHDQTDGHRSDAEFKIANGYLKTAYQITNNIDISSDFSLASFKTTDPGPDTLNAVKGNSLDIQRGYWSFTLNNNYEKFSGSAKLFYNFGEHNITDGFHSTDANRGFNIYESIRVFRGGNLTLGADYLNYGGIAENEKAMGGTGIVFKDTTVYDAGIYGFFQQTLCAKLTLNAGLRLQNHQVYGKEWVPSGGVAWKISTPTTLKASVSKGFRSPTIQELYIWNHNIDLQPVTIMSYEASILQALFERKLKLELTAYIVKGDNLIISVPMQGLQNAGKVLNKGIEFSALADPLKNLQVNLTYSYIDMESPVYATPKHHLYLSANYIYKKIRMTSSVQYINDLDTDASALVNFSSYALLNARISWQALSFAELFLSAENILNQEYENNRYYPLPGFTMFGGIKLNL